MHVARRDALHGLGQDVRRAAFRDVAAGAGGERLLHEQRVLVHAEHEDARARIARDDPANRLEPTHAGQRQVHDHDVRRSFREASVRKLARVGFRHDLDLGRAL